MTNSFTDEFLGKFYVALAAGDNDVEGVQLAGLDEETRDAVTACLERRSGCRVMAQDFHLQDGIDLVSQRSSRCRNVSFSAPGSWQRRGRGDLRDAASRPHMKWAVWNFVQSFRSTEFAA